MSEMSYLEKLLDGVEVEWKTLGSIAELKRGTSITKKDVIDGTIPVVAGGRTPAYYHNTSNRDGQTIVIAGSGAYAGFVSWWEEPIFVSDAFTVKPHNILLPRYCYHFLMNMQQQLHEFKSGGGVPHVYPRDVSPILIPIPCPDNPEKSLAIQSEIVRILDKFTALTAELTAELTMRKKQYNYYRDQLLSFDEGEVEWKMLGDLGENLDSKRKPITSGLREAGSIPYYGASGIVDYVKDYIFDGDFLLISEDGANLLARNTPIAFSISGKSWVNNHAHVIKFDSYAERRYVEYYLNSIDLAPYISGAAQPKLNKKNLESIRIPNPSPEDKERIVSILDKFDALTNSINEGLPREIELRQKQYEYYRDLLFSFPRPETASN
ncbi:restriction endonuclease subunit S [Cronobacter sakazakii]|uniref:restriction endonuclease subunit S n=1 Tax=Cronobacter TaxID=413496 RepID=UPI000CFABF54|nr:MULTISPECIES: restriction endonuclease subunit S [Cronobacter]ELY3981359.1 restriction endonuclease subunit S [Cronobacter sakazakii]ELY4197695.1 restriction endonuclease subunit S [Cronobacter sakazakii]ELY4605358.1 restriction endonuclease subunit S [Cronobacter sakazakii]MDI7598816.1 restriction endonuclease subunit S [Cronobacter sakazakii]MDK1036322.1 restriction endonuclease subunit S [Cronobacter sakazakii]